MAKLRSIISPQARRAKIDRAERKATGTSKPKAKAPAKAKTQGYKVPAKAAAARKATIRAARDADLRAIAAKRKKK